jgi:type II secretion system protein I
MQTQSVRAQSQTEARAFATIVAQNILAEAAAANAPPALGARDGRTDMVGQTWPWRVQVEETLDAGTRRMRVIVRDPQTQAIAADMTAFIALRAGA